MSDVYASLAKTYLPIWGKYVGIFTTFVEEIIILLLRSDSFCNHILSEIDFFYLLSL